MTPQDLLTHLKTAGDSTHAAIFVYLQKLNTFSWGQARQDPGVNSKKIPDSDEEEKEEEEEEREEEEEVAAKKKQDSDDKGKEKEERGQEEGEVAAALDSNDVSCEQVDTYACDHAK